MKKIVIANNKGGVAKTTTVYNLSSYFAKKGKKVLVVDCDPQGNLTDALGVDPNEVESTIFDALNTKNIRKIATANTVSSSASSPRAPFLPSGLIGSRPSNSLPATGGRHSNYRDAGAPAHGRQKV